MLEWLKTSSGAYNVTLIIALIGWLISGVGIVAGFHLNKLKAIEAEAKSKKADSDRDAMTLELAEARAKTAELEKRVPVARRLTPDQRHRFIADLANVPKGPVTIAYVSPLQESTDFVAEIRFLVIAAGFTVPAPSEYALSYTINAPAPWFVAVIVGSGTPPPYAAPVQFAFKDIGIDAIGTDGSQIAKPGELKIYIGSR